MQTGLHIAAMNGNKKLVHRFIEKRAYLDAIDQINRTPLYFAAKKNFGGVVIVISDYNIGIIKSWSKSIHQQR